MSMTVQLHRPVAPTFDVYGDPNAFAALHATDTGGNRITLFFADKAAAVAWLTDAIDAAREAQACDCGKPAGHAGPWRLSEEALVAHERGLNPFGSAALAGAAS